MWINTEKRRYNFDGVLEGNSLAQWVHVIYISKSDGQEVMSLAFIGWKDSVSYKKTGSADLCQISYHCNRLIYFI